MGNSCRELLFFSGAGFFFLPGTGAVREHDTAQKMRISRVFSFIWSKYAI